MAGRPRTRAREEKAGKTKLSVEAAALLGREPYTPLDPGLVRLRLYELRDLCMGRALDLARAGISEGLAIWQGAADRASAELDRMADRVAGSAATRVNLTCNGIDVTAFVFGSNLARPGDTDEP